MSKLFNKIFQKIDPEDSINPVNSVTFLVGPNISMEIPSNVPSPKEIAIGTIEICAPKNKVDELIKKNVPFEIVIEAFNETVDPYLRMMDFYSELVEPNYIHLYLATLINKGFWVFSVNQDYMIELALYNILNEKLHEYVMPIIGKNEFRKYRFPKDIPKRKFPVFKLNGSKWNMVTGLNTYDSMFLTVNSLNEKYRKGFEFSIFPSLINFSKGGNLIILGFEEDNIKYIRPFFKRFMGKLEVDRIIWIENENSDLDCRKILKNPQKFDKIRPELDYTQHLIGDFAQEYDFQYYFCRGNILKFLHNVFINTNKVFTSAIEKEILYIDFNYLLNNYKPKHRKTSRFRIDFFKSIVRPLFKNITPLQSTKFVDLINEKLEYYNQF
ncbi:MAG: hypothetical protein ACTSRZ_15810 [Promethearchaeota archaeon]